MTDLASRKAFIQANTRIASVPGLPIRIYTADELTPIWEATEKDLEKHNIAPPFWAFPWAGGQALARHVLEHPELVAGKVVLDLASGSGLVAIAAAKAGAAVVEANDIDPMCEAALAVNADLNGVSVEYLGDDLLGGDPPEADVILAADVFYEQGMAKRFLAFLQKAHAAGVTVLAGDPGRTYFPRDAFKLLAEYEVETSTEIENHPVKAARVWRL
ncbi:MAG TPA: 50S ribosomal protein L11 methyltransferase [Hyphomonadaceae bacterium]|jgi:predicted nicotinamide N-methyase|nr:50S ribosomal protein L11 methyltransferase [Hyphomonadaceae bacterium]